MEEGSRVDLVCEYCFDEMYCKYSRVGMSVGCVVMTSCRVVSVSYNSGGMRLLSSGLK